MKIFFISTLSVLFFNVLNAQLFTKITAGNIVSSFSDSRSVNFIDINNDDKLDIFISNGPSGGQDNFLYINNGDGTFSSLVNDPIVEDFGKSDGATFADVDNDGFIDAFVVNWYGQDNFFYHNNGNGSFSYLPNVEMGEIGTHSETASWADIDKDGLVDLYVSNSGQNNSAEENLFYKNNGNLNFSRLTNGDFVTETDFSRSVNFTDYDNDGDLDLFVTNESNQANDLYQNEGDGTFVKIESGLIVTSHKKSMSSSWGDIDNDGDLDLFVANAGYFEEQANQLFRNEGNGQFTDITSLEMSADMGCNYGSTFADYNNDGYLDLFVGSGYCSASKLKDFLYKNDGMGNLIRDTESIPDIPQKCSFGAAWGDYDNDGFLDLMIAQCRNGTGQLAHANSLFHNNGNANNWIKIKLQGVESNRSAIGSKVRIKTSVNGVSMWQLREISAQSGYCSQNSLLAHFGLGVATEVDSIIVEWPNGLIQVLEHQNSNLLLKITEGVVDATINPAVFTQIDLQCSPNPVHDILEIKLQFNKLQTIKSNMALLVFDNLGRKVYSNKLDNVNSIFNYSVDTKKWLPGLYFVQIQGEGYCFSKKIMKH